MLRDCAAAAVTWRLVPEHRGGLVVPGSEKYFALEVHPGRVPEGVARPARAVPALPASLGHGLRRPREPCLAPALSARPRLRHPPPAKVKPPQLPGTSSLPLPHL